MKDVRFATNVVRRDAVWGRWYHTPVPRSFKNIEEVWWEIKFKFFGFRGVNEKIDILKEELIYTAHFGEVDEKLNQS